MQSCRVTRAGRPRGLRSGAGSRGKLCSWRILATRSVPCSCTGADQGSPNSPSSSSSSSSSGSSTVSPGTITRRTLLQQTAASSLMLGAASVLGGSGMALFVAPAARAAGGPVTPSPEVKKALDKALSKVVIKGKAAIALRLAFHDAGTFSKAAGDGGPNASILFELNRPENAGLKRGWRVITDVEKELAGTPAEGQVSRADLIALAGAAAVAVCGGPRIPVPIGRVDALVADPENRMPGENYSVADLKANFASKGFSVREMVVLSGAHTIGGKGFGAPDVFDNAYYSSLLRKPWLDPKDPMASMIGLPSDKVLPDDPECLEIIKEYAADQAAFFRAFSDAYVKMTTQGATWKA